MKFRKALKLRTAKIQERQLIDRLTNKFKATVIGV
jgi:hypothetical protein